jgi:hypothetical protein
LKRTFTLSDRGNRSLSIAGEVMNVDKFQDDDDGFRGWKRRNPDGYVINIHRTLNPGDARLHRTNCRTIQGTPPRGNKWTSEYIKLCSPDKRELDEWARSTVGCVIRRCGICNP